MAGHRSGRRAGRSEARTMLVWRFAAGAAARTGARDDADRTERIDQMNVLDRNIGIVETKVDADVKVDAEVPEGTAAPPAPRGMRRLVLPLRRAWQFSVTQSFSSLTRRIIFLNVTGLLALVIRVLSLSQFRAGPIDARVRSLLVQGDLISEAIAALATADSDTVTLDPERLLELQPGG